MISPTISANKPMTTRVCTGLSLPVKGVIPCMRSVYQLAISLKDVWRCVLIPDDYPLVQVHEALVTAMGWEGIHLYAFRIENSIYVEDSYDWPEASIDPSTVRFGELVAHSSDMSRATGCLPAGGCRGPAGVRELPQGHGRSAAPSP